MLNKFFAKPKSKEGWKVFWLGLGSFIVGPFFGILMTFLRRMLDPISYNPTQVFSAGFLGLILGLALSTTTIVLFIRSFKEGERSWAIWIGLFVASLVGLFWILMLGGELLFPH